MASSFCGLNGPLIFGLSRMKRVIIILYMCALLLSTACHVLPMLPHVLYLFSATVNVVVLFADVTQQSLFCYDRF